MGVLAGVRSTGGFNLTRAANAALELTEPRGCCPIRETEAELNLEICLDNYESLANAVRGGADRIELCASLSEGGLTPPVSFIEVALRLDVPIFVMIRPRSCDFLYTSDELEMMHRDIRTARELGAPGVVLGVLTASGEIDQTAMRSLIKEAGSMDVTCHRAVDQVKDIFAAVDTLAELGVKRMLSSGQARTAFEGIDVLAQLVAYSKGRIGIMAGAGVTPANVRQIVTGANVDEVHSAAAAMRPSAMAYTRTDALMGNGQDFRLEVVDEEKVRQLRTQLRGL